MPLSAVILAAGKATRMKSQRVKVLHEVCGRPMLSYVIDAVRAAGVTRIILVVGHDRERVIAQYSSEADIAFVTQQEQKGTGHAVLVCRDALTDAMGDRASATFVLAGDGPLIRPATLQQLHAEHARTRASMTLATAVLANPTGYGRIVRDENNHLLGIIEQYDATAEQKEIQEVNPSYYLFNTADLFWALDRVRPNNAKNEYYLTDTLEVLKQAGKTAAAVASVPAEDVLSINSRAELAAVNRVMQKRIQQGIMEMGVTLVSPENTWIEFGAQIGVDSIVEPFCFIGAEARIAAETHLAAHSRIE